MGERFQLKQKAQKSKPAVAPAPQPKPVLLDLVDKCRWLVNDSEIPRLTKEWTVTKGGQNSPVGYRIPGTAYCRWIAKRDVQAPPGSKLLMHGTSTQNLATIMLRGFWLPDHNGMFGRGIYLTDSKDKALGFALRWNEGGALIKAYADLGRVLVADKSKHYDRAMIEGMGYDTVHGMAGKTKTWGDCALIHNEWCVYRKTRIYITSVEMWAVVPTKG